MAALWLVVAAYATTAILVILVLAFTSGEVRPVCRRGHEMDPDAGTCWCGEPTAQPDEEVAHPWGAT